jgi:MFS family permease
VVVTASPQAPTGPPAQPRKAALAAWIGSALEYYDFFIYGTAAALVFNKLFFPGAEPATGTLLALATFGAGYVARPVGAFVLGHLGDRFGRKRILVSTVLLMGVATFAVGCLPTYASIGIAAPIILVVLRLLQGFSAGGEQAGAWLDAHGAGPGAAASLAEAVAARVLVGQGTALVDWVAAGDDEPAAFLATAILAARCPPRDEPVGAHGRWPGH